jgi:nanoRNase/pAp phosphatase (c-di-AMP/oligoRNAs hydrolase)
VDLIIYHNNCPDGFTAAYIAKKRFPEATLYPRDHGLPVPYEDLIGKDVLVVDFSFRKKEENRAVAAAAKSFLILDHHKTAQAELEGERYAVFDMNRSGAGLAWDCLFGKNAWPRPGIDAIPDGYSRPWWVNYVEDRDLWRHKLPYSKEVNAFIMTFPYTIEGWNRMSALTVEQAIESGKVALLQVDHYVREAVKQAQYSTWNIVGQTYSTAVLNVPYLNCSEIGDVLSGGVNVSVTWFERGDGIIQFSLRSKGDVDVSKIALVYGGGGHKNAAGFQLPLAEGRAAIDKILGRYISQEQVNALLDALIDKILGRYISYKVGLDTIE